MSMPCRLLINWDGRDTCFSERGNGFWRCFLNCDNKTTCISACIASRRRQATRTNSLEQWRNVNVVLGTGFEEQRTYWLGIFLSIFCADFLKQLEIQLHEPQTRSSNTKHNNEKVVPVLANLILLQRHKRWYPLARHDLTLSSMLLRLEKKTDNRHTSQISRLILYQQTRAVLHHTCRTLESPHQHCGSTMEQEAQIVQHLQYPTLWHLLLLIQTASSDLWMQRCGARSKWHKL